LNTSNLDLACGSPKSLEILPEAKITSLRQIVLSRDELLIRLSRFGISISVLVLLAGMLVVGLTMSAAVRERTRKIGIFRAIGFHRWHIAGIILLEGVMISAIGGAVCYLVGTVAARIAGPLIAQTALAVPWCLELMLITILLAITTGTLTSLYPT
jgi:putative ABC transport system permease protein